MAETPPVFSTDGYSPQTDPNAQLAYLERNATMAQRDVSLSPGAYDFSFWARDNLSWEFTFMDAQGTAIGSRSGSAWSPFSGLTQFTIEITVPAGTTTFDLEFTAVSESVLIDLVSSTEIDAGVPTTTTTQVGSATCNEAPPVAAGQPVVPSFTG